MNQSENPFLNIQEEGKTNIFLDILQSVIIAVAISVFLYVFIVTPNEVDGSSMEPNFETGDLLFTSKLHQWFNGSDVGNQFNLNYQRGDVIVFQEPGREDFVKRIIGMPGEMVRIENGTIYINEEPVEEGFEIYNSEKKDGSFLEDGDSAIEIPENNYIALGDNRNVSFDSRSIGFIESEWIKGRVVFRFWPLEKIGIIESGQLIIGN